MDATEPDYYADMETEFLQKVFRGGLSTLMKTDDYTSEFVQHSLRQLLTISNVLCARKQQAKEAEAWLISMLHGPSIVDSERIE